MNERHGVKHLRAANEAFAGKKSGQKNGVSRRDPGLAEKLQAAGSTLRLQAK
jgi:hypothetical protein